MLYFTVLIIKYFINESLGGFIVSEFKIPESSSGCDDNLASEEEKEEEEGSDVVVLRVPMLFFP